MLHVPGWVYGIAVTSDLVGTGVQNLRAYEKAGLLEPTRTAGGTRLYSSDDITRLRRRQTLLSQGLNLAGIAMVLKLEEENQRLHPSSTTPVRTFSLAGVNGAATNTAATSSPTAIDRATINPILI